MFTRPTNFLFIIHRKKKVWHTQLNSLAHKHTHNRCSCPKNKFNSYDGTRSANTWRNSQCFALFLAHTHGVWAMHSYFCVALMIFRRSHSAAHIFPPCIFGNYARRSSTRTISLPTKHKNVRSCLGGLFLQLLNGATRLHFRLAFLALGFVFISWGDGRRRGAKAFQIHTQAQSQAQARGRDEKRIDGDKPERALPDLRQLPTQLIGRRETSVWMASNSCLRVLLNTGHSNKCWVCVEGKLWARYSNNYKLHTIL